VSIHIHGKNQMYSCLMKAALGSRFLGLWTLGSSYFGAPYVNRNRSDVFVLAFFSMQTQESG